MSGKIVDTPCRDMNTLHFVDVVKEVAQELGTKPPTLIVGKELEEKGVRENGFSGMDPTFSWWSEHNPDLKNVFVMKFMRVI